MRRSKGITDIVELEGFLTAVVIGPVTLMPSRWLPRVLGGRNPGFRTEQEFGEFTRLVMGFKWSPIITPAVRAIHAYWLPKRHADYEAACATMTVRREAPKVGRNDPCPWITALMQQIPAVEAPPVPRILTSWVKRPRNC